MQQHSKNSRLARLKSDWVDDAIQNQPSAHRIKVFSTVVTIISCLLYIAIYQLVSDVRDQVADHIHQLTIFTRIVLNITQPFLIVFIIVSVSLLVLLFIRVKKAWLSQKLLTGLIGFNCVFAALLLAVSLLKVS